jgi:hypothetical protein
MYLPNIAYILPRRWCDSAAYRGYEPRAGQTNDNTISICSFSSYIKEYEQILCGSKPGWRGEICLQVDCCFLFPFCGQMQYNNTIIILYYSNWFINNCVILLFISWLDFYGASLLKQQSTCRHISPRHPGFEPHNICSYSLI